MPHENFWRGKRVLLTGHTGFKGAWAHLWLTRLGATVHHLALAPETSPNLSHLLNFANGPHSVIGDIRDPLVVRRAITQAQPQIVLHMAAQALVRRSYAQPVDTFDINVNGTLRVLDALRGQTTLEAVLVVTSDKVYENDGSGRAFIESDSLGGSDPYSASKAACEIATSSFARSYFTPSGIPVATARAGNVIGGGDWSADRIVPDLWRAQQIGRKVELRNPEATRPWQHVMEPIAGYLDFLEALAGGLRECTLNFGPIGDGPLTVCEVAETFQGAYGAHAASGWSRQSGEQPKEASTLAIDARRATQVLPWRPRLTASEAISWTAAWYAAFDAGADMAAFTQTQISDYEVRCA